MKKLFLILSLAVFTSGVSYASNSLDDCGEDSVKPIIVSATQGVANE